MELREPSPPISRAEIFTNMCWLRSISCREDWCCCFFPHWMACAWKTHFWEKYLSKMMQNYVELSAIYPFSKEKNCNKEKKLKMIKHLQFLDWCHLVWCHHAPGCWSLVRSDQSRHLHLRLVTVPSPISCPHPASFFMKLLHICQFYWI